MKFKFIVFFLCLAVLTPTSAIRAFGTPSLGSVSNPVYVQVQEDPSQLYNDAFDKAESIQYVPACASTYSTVNAEISKTIKGINVGDPFSIKSAATYLNYLYTHYELCVSYTQKWDQDCKNKFGPYGKLSSVDSINQKYACGCQTGYVSNEAGTQCVSYGVQTPAQVTCAAGTILSGNECIPANAAQNTTWADQVNQISDKVCKQTSGVNSFYANETDVNKGGGMGGCGCMPGYHFDHGNYGQCVVTPPTPQSTNNQSIAPVAPVVSANPDTAVSFTYHANRAVPIAEKDMALISSANLRSCPNETCGSLGEYPTGTIFTVTERYNDVFGWYGGTTPDGKEGWIYPGLLTDRVDNSKNEIASSSATSSQSALSVPVHVNMQVSTSTNTLPQKGFWERVRGWFGF